MLPEIAEANRRYDALKDEMRMLFTSLKDSLREVASAKNTGGDESVKILLEAIKASNDQRESSQRSQTELQMASMKQQSDMMIALITSMNKEKPQDNGMFEAIKMNIESQKQTTQMMMESSKNENSVMRDLFTSVVTQRLSAPDDQVKVHRDAEDRGWTKAMELTRLLEEARSGSDDTMEIDPEGGFWGNISNIALQGLQRAVRSGVGGGGLRGALQSALSPMAGYPQENPVPAPVYYQPQPQQLPQPVQRPVQRLPAVVTHNPTPVLPSSIPEVQASPLFEGAVNEDGSSVPVVTPPPQSQQVPALPAPQSSQEQRQASSGEEEEDLCMHVTEAMRMALDDFKVGRKVHDWSDHAIDKWHRQFKIELAQAADDAARIQLIGSKCEAAVYEQVISRIRRGGPDVFYFTQAIQAVVQDVAKEYSAA